MKKFMLLLVLPFLSLIHMAAQNEEVLNLKMEVRADYMKEFQGEETINANSGFKGKFFNIRLDGKIAEGLTYSFRYRINKANINSSIFDATDWVTMTYHTGNWDFSAGKQVIAIGGYEYDAAPIELYFCSEYWHNLVCYQFGLSSEYTFNENKDRLMFQFTESPFRRDNRLSYNPSNKEMFAYNLLWTGSHDFFSTMYSVNMIEYAPGKFMNYIALGNRFTFGDFLFDFDFMNRASSTKGFFGNDFSIMSELKWAPADWVNVFARLSYDRNKSDFGDLCVLPGTDITRFGGGAEFFPLKKSKNLRFHVAYSYTTGKAVETGALQHDQSIIDTGITWRMNLLNVKKK